MILVSESQFSDCNPLRQTLFVFLFYFFDEFSSQKLLQRKVTWPHCWCAGASATPIVRPHGRRAVVFYTAPLATQIAFSVLYWQDFVLIFSFLSFSFLLFPINGHGVAECTVCTQYSPPPTWLLFLYECIFLLSYLICVNYELWPSLYHVMFVIFNFLCKIGV